MRIHVNIGKLTVKLLEKYFTIEKKNIGSYAVVKRKGVRIVTDVYTIEGIGKLCVLNIKAPLGVLKCETIIISTNKKDMPLFNADWISVFSNEMQMCELYDVQLKPYPEEKLAEFEKIKERDCDLKEYETDAHWYDNIKYPCSYSKKSKTETERFTDAFFAYLTTFIRQLSEAGECDSGEKQGKINEFAEKIYSEGGPAVDFFKNAVGEEKAKDIILN